MGIRESNAFSGHSFSNFVLICYKPKVVEKKAKPLQIFQRKIFLPFIGLKDALNLLLYIEENFSENLDLFRASSVPKRVSVPLVRKLEPNHLLISNLSSML